MDEKIQLKEYGYWKEDRVTKVFIKFLEEVVEEAKGALLNPGFIKDPQKGQLELNYWLGYKDAASQLLERFTFDYTKEEIKNEEIAKSSLK